MRPSKPSRREVLRDVAFQADVLVAAWLAAALLLRSVWVVLVPLVVLGVVLLVAVVAAFHGALLDEDDE